MASTSNPPKISLSLGAKKPKAQPRPQLGKRPRSALQDEPEDEEPSTEPQTITGFENGTSIAVDDKPKQGPRIIAALKNRDFGDEARRKRQRSGLPTGGQGQTAEPAAGSDDGEPKQYGLIMNRTKHDDAETENVQAQEDVVTDGPSRAKTEDELAMDALTGKKSSSTRTIPVNEDEVYHEDMGQVPEAPNQATYASMPVDDFGKALLAGMGWKEGQAVGRRNRGKAEAEQRDVQRRPEQLGLGAKEDALLRAESGADRKARRKGVQNIYNPVVLRNKATGEAYTEEELKAKQEQQKLELSNGNKGRDDSRERNYDRRRDDRNKRRDAGRDYKHGDRDSGRNERDRRRRHADGDESYSKSRSSRRDRSSSTEDRYRRRHRKERSLSREDRQRYRDRPEKDRSHRK